MTELVEKPCLTDSRLTDDTDHLAVSFTRPIQAPGENLELFATADKWTQTDNRGRVQLSFCGRGAQQFINRLRLGDSLDRNESERSDLDESFHQLEGLLA